MPESSYGFDEGTARRQHTYQHTVGGTAVEDLVVAQGLAPFATYTIMTPPSDMATANMHLLEIMAGATNRIGIRRIVLLQRTNAGAATLGTFDLFRLTTAGTGGTATTPQRLDPADSAADHTARYAVSSSLGTETGAALWRATGLVTNSLTTVGVNTSVVDWRFGEGGITKMPWIAAGTANGICLKSVTAVGTATVTVMAEVVELPYS